MAESLNLKPLELQRMNACWMYLQVVTLADIADSSGKKVCCLSISRDGIEMTNGVYMNGKVMFAYPESNPPHQFCKTGATVVFNQP
jgi:hypothetical protein